MSVNGAARQSAKDHPISIPPPHPRHVLVESGCIGVTWRTCAMSDEEYARKLDELDRLLNDPDVPIQPARIWSLLAEVSRPEITGSAARQPGVSAPSAR